MRYLGIEPINPKVAVFDFTSCEGCELQLLNKEDTLIDFLSLIEVVNFREASSEKSDDYDIALIEGAIS
jgi:sulfhydrogenase subunit delta